MDRIRAGKFRAVASRIVSEEGFTINAAKTRLMGQGNRQTVTGVVVNQTLGLSRQERRRLRAIAHQMRTRGEGTGQQITQAQFTGKMAFLSMLNPQQAARIDSA